MRSSLSLSPPLFPLIFYTPAINFHSVTKRPAMFRTHVRMSRVHQSLNLCTFFSGTRTRRGFAPLSCPGFSLRSEYRAKFAKFEATRFAARVHMCTRARGCTSACTITCAQICGNYAGSSFVRSAVRENCEVGQAGALLRYAAIYARLIGRNLSRSGCTNFRGGFMHSCREQTGVPRAPRRWALIARLLLYYFARREKRRRAIGSIRHGRQKRREKKKNCMRKFVSRVHRARTYAPLQSICGPHYVIIRETCSNEARKFFLAKRKGILLK